ncbi:hypothetical protein F2981_24750 (plasmid) [Sinorhizobium meliloti]|nr:hypothetical protein [Sinorhizobium meliloti]
MQQIKALTAEPPAMYDSGKNSRADTRPVSCNFPGEVGGPIMRTQVVIIGSGPSGSCSGNCLTGAGIANVIPRSRDPRITFSGRVPPRRSGGRHGAADEEAGCGVRMHAEASRMTASRSPSTGATHRIDLFGLTGGRR